MADRRTEAVRALVRILGHEFRDPSLLERALTHPSVGEGAALDAAGRPILDNQRLEFFGDRVLGLLVAEWLMLNFPRANEGEMSSRLHGLVDKQACARVGEAAGLGPALRMSPGESKQGGRRREGILADAVEAVLGAVYFDGGIDAARTSFERLWKDELSNPSSRSHSNPKSALQEWSLRMGRGLPHYRVVDRSGSDHAPTFRVAVEIDQTEPLTAEGRSRQEAEKAAALAVLKREGVI